MICKVLIVEDDDLLREIYGIRLQMEGYDVHTAGDGEEGLEKVVSVQPDIILLDMLMPRLDGLGFLRHYLKLPNRAKVIVASNKSSQQSIAEAKLLGATDYLIKSQLTPDDLVVQIKKHLAPA